MCFFLRIYFLNDLLVKNYFFEKKHLFIFSWFSSLSPLFFGEGRRRGILSIFNCLKKFFVMFFNMFFRGKKFTFFLFSFLFFLSFSCPCFSLGHGDQMADDKTRHQDKRVKSMVGMVTKVWKKSPFLACFWAWPKVGVDGPESTKETASVGWIF